MNVHPEPIAPLVPFGGDAPVFAPIEVPDTVTAAVMAGAPQVGTGAELIPGDELAGLHAVASAMVNSAQLEKAFRDGVLYAAFRNARRDDRAQLVAAEYGLEHHEIGEYAPSAPRDR